MHTFTIDFVGLVNAQQMPLATLAKRAGLLRDRAHVIAYKNPPRYHRVKVGKMLVVLGVQPYFPFRLDQTEEGPRLTVDWEPLLNHNATTVPGLVKQTRLRHHVVYHMVCRDPAEYNRVTQGALLNALDVRLYPPFFIENDSITEGTHDYRPARKYYRARNDRNG